MSKQIVLAIATSVVLLACGAPSTVATVPTDRSAALAPVEVTEPEPPEITGVTIDSGGRITPLGVSGADPVAELEGTTLDPTYGFTPQNPVHVGGANNSENPEVGEQSYLNALWGPQGQPISYRRLGSCCPQTDFGMLDIFAITYDGLEGDELVVYLDAYHLGPLYAPVGLRSVPREGDEGHR